MLRYSHLTEDDRYEIYERKGRGDSLTAIAQHLNRSKSTISREIARNTGACGYRPKQAHQLARHRSTMQRGGKSISRETLARCKALIREGHSPEQAAGRALLEGYTAVSHETLYRVVYADKATGGSLWRNLRCCKLRRKRYGSGRSRRGKIPNRVGIEARPISVESRATVGHWEADTVIGKNHKFALVTLVERKTGLCVIRKVRSKQASGVATAIIEALRPIRPLVRTITFDNGLEFARHTDIAKALSAKTFFADPYASWQRGTNENLNGLLRQHYPKCSSFSSITAAHLQRRQDTLNQRARKRLAYRTPYEAMLPAAKRAGVALAL